MAFGFGRASYGPAVAGLGGALGRLAGRIGATERPPCVTEVGPSRRDLAVELEAWEEIELVLPLVFIGD